MKKFLSKFSFILAWALSVLLCFVIIFVFVFFNGWKLFESCDPIKIEIGASVILGTIFWIIMHTINELGKKQEEKNKELEERIKELEKKI